MEENRHPINEAGIGSLIETVIDRWNQELDPTETTVEIHRHAKVGHRACTLIDTVHTVQRDSYFFHHVKVFIDHEHGVPIRFEAYNWPKKPGLEPELMEEYTYSDLKTDIGLTDLDFDPANPHYSYGRFLIVTILTKRTRFCRYLRLGTRSRCLWIAIDQRKLLQISPAISDGHWQLAREGRCRLRSDLGRQSGLR